MNENKKEFTVDQVLTFVLMGDTDSLQEAIEAGFDVNSSLSSGGSLAEVAQAAANMKVLRLLWEAGAKPTTPWLQRVFNDFTYSREQIFLSPTVETLDYPDLTKDFSVRRLKFSNGTMNFKGIGSSIEIPIMPFVLEGKLVRTSVRLDGISLPSREQDLLGRTFKFPINPNEGYIDGSVYIRGTHNPVDVYFIMFGSNISQTGSIHARMEMEFNFEYERTDLQNEKLTIDVDLQISK